MTVVDTNIHSFGNCENRPLIALTMSVDTRSTTKGLRRLSLTPETINASSSSTPHISDGTFSPSHGKRMTLKRMSSISYIPSHSTASATHLRSPPPAIQEVNENADPNPSRSLPLRRSRPLPRHSTIQSSPEYSH